MCRTRALCTCQNLLSIFELGTGTEDQNPIGGTSQREDSNLWECSRCRGGAADQYRRRIPQHGRLRPRLQDTKPGPRAGEIGRKKHARASCHKPLGPTCQALPTKLRVRPRAAPALTLFCFFSCSPSPAAALRREPPKTLTLSLGDLDKERGRNRTGDLWRRRERWRRSGRSRAP